MPVDLSDLIFKDSCLLSKFKLPTISFPIIKRRIAWLMGQWIGNDCSPANNPRVWDVLVHLLQDYGPGTDAVVRLTAAVALRECVDVRYILVMTEIRANSHAERRI
jgi:hypothetical protein